MFILCLKKLKLQLDTSACTAWAIKPAPSKCPTIKTTTNLKVLAIREDRKIILEKVLILKDKIILANSKISFNKLVKAKLKNNRENVTVKATLLKKVFDY